MSSLLICPKVVTCTFNVDEIDTNCSCDLFHRSIPVKVNLLKVKDYNFPLDFSHSQEFKLDCGDRMRESRSKL